MRDKQLYKQILGIQAPWTVADVELNTEAGEVKVHIEPESGTELVCPRCGTVCSGYDKRQRKWRHLDTCQYRTILVAEVPRVNCPAHGVLTVDVPWAEPGAGYTALFEALVIDWLQEASTQAVARLMDLSWNAIDGIMQRAVKRGLARREVIPPKRIGVDETSFRKRHDYVTVVSDPTRKQGPVLYVADERTKQSLAGYYNTLTQKQKSGIESVSMDMWPAYINATLKHIPDAREKIAFDKFHVAKYLGEAVDKVRRAEHKELMKAGWEDLKGTKYDWLTKPANKSHKQRLAFTALRESSLKTARAWGDQGVRHTSVALRQPHLGGEGVETLVGLGGQKPPGSGQEGCQNHQGTPMGNSQRRGPRRRQRPCGKHQQPDPDDQDTQSWIPQQRAIPERHLLPSWRTESLSERGHKIGFTHSIW